MGCPRSTISRRHTLIALLGAATPYANAFGRNAEILYPIYSAKDALQGLYRHLLPGLARAFVAETEVLRALATPACPDRATWRAMQVQWGAALLAWQRLSTPGLGPVLKRRSQRKIDFWPVRPALLDKALAMSFQTLDGLVAVGTPAKGFPALELLLFKDPDPQICQYISLLTADIALEAQALNEGYEQLAHKDWSSFEEEARLQFAEWINQWLGGWERLRWTQIEQPILRGQTNGEKPVFARKEMLTNHREWRTQLGGLLAQARWSEAIPPRPGEDLVPIEALLRGKGELRTAARWGQALDGVAQAFEQLNAQSPSSKWLGFAQKMKSVTALYQDSVALALDIPLGFSDADGD